MGEEQRGVIVIMVWFVLLVAGWAWFGSRMRGRYDARANNSNFHIRLTEAWPELQEGNDDRSHQSVSCSNKLDPRRRIGIHRRAGSLQASR